jgi:hypothetical protein
LSEDASGHATISYQYHRTHIKEVLVRPEVADKGKGENIVISDPHTSNISQEEIACKAPDKKTSKSGGTKRRLN